MKNNNHLPAAAQPNGLTAIGATTHSSNRPTLTIQEKALAKELRSSSEWQHQQDEQRRERRNSGLNSIY